MHLYRLDQSVLGVYVVRHEHPVPPPLLPDQVGDVVHPLGVRGKVDVLPELVVGALGAEQVVLAVAAQGGEVGQHRRVQDGP